MSPILFLIYINDLLKVNINNGEIISFADVTTLIFSGSTWENAARSATAGLITINSWLDEHLLTLNYKKSVFLTFTPTIRTYPLDLNHLYIHTSSCHWQETEECQCPTLGRSNNVKYLGVILDSHLRWDYHINNMCLKMRYLIFKSYKISKLKNLEIAGLVYCAYTQSVLQYGILVWGGATNTYLRKLIVIQKFIINKGFFGCG